MESGSYFDSKPLFSLLPPVQLHSYGLSRARRHPFDAVIAGHGHGFRRHVNFEKRPRAWDERIFFDDALVNFHTQAWTPRHNQVTTLDGERLAQNFIRERERIH